MSDVVTCPGCGGVVDRDEYLLCPTCHTDVTGVVAATPTGPPAPSRAIPAARPAASDATPAARLAALRARPAAPAAARGEAPDGGSWTCASPGCEHSPPLAATVAACPFCLEPRAGATATPDARGGFELRDESGAIVVALSGPGPWRLGRREADSGQLAGCLTVSRSHALLARRASGLAVSDLGSSNHTFVGAVALRPGEERIVEPGAPIGLGKTVVLRVHAT